MRERQETRFIVLLNDNRVYGEPYYSELIRQTNKIYITELYIFIQYLKRLNFNIYFYIEIIKPAFETLCFLSITARYPT